PNEMSAPVHPTRWPTPKDPIPQNRTKPQNCLPLLVEPRRIVSTLRRKQIHFFRYLIVCELSRPKAPPGRPAASFVPGSALCLAAETAGRPQRLDARRVRTRVLSYLNALRCRIRPKRRRPQTAAPCACLPMAAGGRGERGSYPEPPLSRPRRLTGT